MIFEQDAFVETVVVAPTAFVEVDDPPLYLFPMKEMCTTSVSLEGDMELSMERPLSMRYMGGGSCLLPAITKNLQEKKTAEG